MSVLLTFCEKVLEEVVKKIAENKATGLLEKTNLVALKDNFQSIYKYSLVEFAKQLEYKEQSTTNQHILSIFALIETVEAYQKHFYTEENNEKDFTPALLQALAKRQKKDWDLELWEIKQNTSEQFWRPYFESFEQIFQGMVHKAKSPALLAVERNLRKSQSKKVKKQLTNLPTINPIDVIGREQELQDLAKLIETKQKVAVVKGIGGIGKTTLAKLYVAQYKDQYNYIVWLTQDAASVKSSFVLHPILSDRLGLKFTKDDDENKRFRAISHALNQLEKPCLLVIDNATLLLQAPEIQEVLPSLDTWKILATSRQVLSKFELFTLGKLSPDKAKELFLKFYEDYTEEEEKDLTALLEEIDYHTLMIELLAKILQESLEVTNVAELLTYLQNHQLDDEILEESIRIGHSESEVKLYKHILATFSLVGLNDEEKWLLQQFSVLPSQEIEAMFFLSDLLNLPKEEITPTNRILKVLVKKGWLQSSKSNQYQLHRILQEVVRYQLPVTFEKVERLVVNLENKLGNEAVKLTEKMILLPFSGQMVTFLKAENQIVGLLSIYIGEIYQTIGQLKHSLEFIEKANAIFVDLQDSPNIAVTYSKLGTLYEIQGQFNKAFEFFKKENVLFEELCNENPNKEQLQQGLAISFSKLGNIHQVQGQFDKAFDFFLTYNRLSEELNNSNPNKEELQKSLAISYEKLGSIYQAQGQFKEALDFFLKYNRLSEKLYNSNPNKEELKNRLAISYLKLGDFYQVQGQFDKSIKFFLKYTKFCKELYENNQNSEDLKSGLVVSYERLGAIYQTEEYFDKALEFFQLQCKLAKELCENNPTNEYLKNGLAISYVKLGDVYDIIGQFGQALSFFVKYSQLCEELYKNNPTNENVKNGLAVSYERIGSIFQNQGHFDNALDFFQAQYVLRKELYENNSNNYELYENLAINCFKLAELYKALGQKDIALDFYLKVKTICEELWLKTQLPSFKAKLEDLDKRITSL